MTVTKNGDGRAAYLTRQQRASRSSVLPIPGRRRVVGVDSPVAGKIGGRPVFPDRAEFYDRGLLVKDPENAGRHRKGLSRR